MNMYNENELSKDYVVDIELLRMEILIEQQENYEKEFLSIESPTDELDYHLFQYESLIENYEINCLTDDFEEEFDYLFEQEDSLMNMRDEILIKEHEKGESFELIGLEFIDEDLFEFQIESMEEDKYLEENFQDFDFDFDPEDYGDMQYEEELSWDLHYLRESQFETQSRCGCPYDDYMPNDDGLCDYLDCYDYPEGPNENLSGIKYY
ncbi:hypothetical protein [Methanobrevibacter sp.]|uniref:hypothetical protein n=1 Tax=Methanobrevibacter sp. TaxID=66852 RepID=UPI00386C60E4